MQSLQSNRKYLQSIYQAQDLQVANGIFTCPLPIHDGVVAGLQDIVFFAWYC